ncbi:DUF3108 domain-containing protein [Pararoseomonas indoligenes]|uniref:DUF3108 domain-containing protein n=1 Tax=Roseomonas indoligenes TaxID=2820811 RepID=A0A940N3L1_9PROT|nr:DUF3108 domain-containing protein [Pararoseomonas indoligenes]MBP0493582.1 DUF3108 domain-containing protein [Pararoseomonas indoligenes]
MNPVRPARLALLAVPALLFLTGAPSAQAQPIAATYTVQAVGMTVMEVNATLDITEAGYTVEFRTRTRGVVAAFSGGTLVTRVEGVWEGDRARPRRYVSEGVWRGENRRTVIEWPGNQPAIRAMVPPNDEERETVPEDARRNTVDNLSAIAQLVRQARRTGNCDGSLRAFDGRRLSETTARSRGREQFAPARDEWSGTALRCDFEGRFLAGFRKDEDREAARRPQTGTAWLGEAAPGRPLIPVRIDSVNRWFGTISARLASFGPPGEAQARAGN